MCNQYFWVWLLRFAVLQMCVCGTWTHLVCIHDLTHFPSLLCSAQVFCLYCTLVWLFCCKTHLSSQTPSWLWLVWTNSPAFTSLVYRPVGTISPNCTVLSQIIVLWTCVKSANTWTLPYPSYWTYWKWQITMLNRKLLEKQMVQNPFASCEIHFFFIITMLRSVLEIV